jgi:hypothetical protein
MKIRFLLSLLLCVAVALCQTAIPQNTIEQQAGPAALVAGANSGAPLPTVNAWLLPGSWLSAGSTAVVLVLKDGNGIPQGNAWSITANSTVYPPAGTYFPGGIVISCTSGCTGSNANYYMHFKVASN